MLIKNRFLTLLVWISLLTSSVGHAQSASELFNFANKCFAEKNYEAAINSYNRLIYFDNDRYGKDCFYKLGLSYLATQRNVEAASNFDLAYSNTNNDSIKIECTFLKCLSFMLEKNYEYALLEVFNLPEQMSPRNTNKKLFYEASIYLMKDELKTSDSLYTSLFKQKLSNYNSYVTLLKKFNRDNRIQVKTAKTLSYILPGAGQMYAGDVKNSLNSLILSASFFALYLVVGNTVSPIEAVIGIGPWFQRYYTGGVKHAGAIALEKKATIKKQYYVNLIDIYSNFINENSKQ